MTETRNISLWILVLLATSWSFETSDRLIDLRGFGTFSTRDSAARTGRNPQTGVAIQIPARRVPGFKPGKELRDRVNDAAIAANKKA